MWNQGCSHSIVGTSSYKTAPSKKAHLEIFPCTVSQLLAAAQLSNDCFTICNCELKQDCSLMTIASPGTYAKVIGSLHSYSQGQRSLLAMEIRCIKDLNEISSHMLEVVQAHMKLFGKVFDVNMNTTVVPEPDWSSGMDPQDVLPNGLSTVQGQVLHLIQMFSDHDKGISFHDLRTKLDYISMRDIRSSLAFLINEGHIFSTIDEHHFKSE
ncbi:replication protein A 32 kDa subunit-like isoform X3 [Girardinichthys multiradiatus]|uniref:replication protein A 32 kDa subunit-like isoform X3 n=1 Tax=Girardinichthys multiradiatus TaxID=208333 RepID=UPI001FAD4A56|nr:replication protein A 32 kDa subunit-like isoform X3 [Girardinichthys multiradiatus]